MPPIPPNISEEAQTLTTNITRRQTHLSSTRIPELRDCKGPLSAQQQLAEDVREEIAYISRQLEILDGMVDDQKGERARTALQSVIDDFRSTLVDLRTQTRSAILYSKKAIDANAQSARSELFSAPSNQDHAYPPSQNKTNGGHDPNSLQSTSDALTDSLYRTLNLLQTSLSQSSETNQLLEQSTASLRATSNQHSALSTTIESTKIIVRALEKADWMDRMLIGAAFLFFLAVVAFVLKQRVLDKGVGILGWAFSWVGLVWRILAWVVKLFVGGGGDYETEAVKESLADVKEVSDAILSASLIASSLAGVASVTVSSSLSTTMKSAVVDEVQSSKEEIPVASDDSPVPLPSITAGDHDEL